MTANTMTNHPRFLCDSCPTWAEVLEANEFFDGEPEVTESAEGCWKTGGYHGMRTVEDMVREYERRGRWGR